jgi:hypothetical protein
MGRRMAIGCTNERDGKKIMVEGRREINIQRSEGMEERA